MFSGFRTVDWTGGDRWSGTESVRDVSVRTVSIGRHLNSKRRRRRMKFSGRKVWKRWPWEVCVSDEFGQRLGQMVASGFFYESCNAITEEINGTNLWTLEPQQKWVSCLVTLNMYSSNCSDYWSSHLILVLFHWFGCITWLRFIG